MPFLSDEVYILYTTPFPSNLLTMLMTFLLPVLDLDISLGLMIAGRSPGGTVQNVRCEDLKGIVTTLQNFQ